MRISKSLIICFSLLVISTLTTSCASTGPKITKKERDEAQELFTIKFIQASEKWLPRVYRIGYRLLNSPVPDYIHKGKPTQLYRFVGIGVEELTSAGRTVYKIPVSVKGVLVRGLYPGSQAEGLDIQPGDVIQRLDGTKIDRVRTYFRKIRNAAGRLVKVQIWRDGRQIERYLPIEKVFYNAQFFIAPSSALEVDPTLFSKVFVGVGAIRYCKNDDELAVLMGHELAHTALKHPAKKLGIRTGSRLVFGSAAKAINIFGIPGVGNLVVDPLEKATDAAVSRRYEREADYFGMLHAFHSNFNVTNGSKVFSRIATDNISTGFLASAFAEQPKASERFLRVEKVIAELNDKYPGRIEEADKNSDWEIIIPVENGETYDQVLNRLVEERRPEPQSARVVTTVNPIKLPSDPAVAYQHPPAPSAPRPKEHSPELVVTPTPTPSR